MTLFDLAVVVVAIASGATASVAGFGIGSLLTPLLASHLGMTTAVAAVAIPHALATAFRAWRLRAHVDWTVLRTFGLLSAAGSLTGALLFTRFSNRALTVTLAVLLLATAIAGLTNWNRRWHPGGPGAALFGFGSGVFGGLAGNQGGLRAAALLAFPLAPLAFVATSTMTGLLVDAARLPIYLGRAGGEIAALARPIALASAGVLMGTLLGERILLGMSRDVFHRTVSALIGLLGAWLLFR